MPLNNPSPEFCLMTSFNARSWSGVQVLARGAATLTLPTYATGAGVYEDMISLLNGRGSKVGQDASSLMLSGATFGSMWIVDINSSDKITITSTSSFTVDLLGPLSSDQLGFGLTQVAAVLVGGDYVATAPNDWERGQLGGFSYTITEVGGLTRTFIIPSASLHIQDVPSYIRVRGGTSDIDDVNVTDCLEALDQTATSSSFIRWFINDTGHTVCEYTNTLMSDITWSSTTFRDRLGFTGEETPVVSGTRSILTASSPAPGCLYPSRPYQAHHLKTENVAQARRMIGGGYASNNIGSYISSMLMFDVDGLLDDIDLYRHFTNEFINYASKGERVNFYQCIGDSRRALISARVNANQPAYDLLYTSEDNGDSGRVRASILNAGFNLAYPSKLRRRVPVSMELEHL